MKENKNDAGLSDSLEAVKKNHLFNTYGEKSDDKWLKQFEKKKEQNYVLSKTIKTSLLISFLI